MLGGVWGGHWEAQPYPEPNPIRVPGDPGYEAGRAGWAGSARNDVFPAGSYSVGDQWFAAQEFVDHGYDVNYVNKTCRPEVGGLMNHQCGYALCWGGGAVWFPCYIQADYENVNYHVYDWHTRYLIWEYDPPTWATNNPGVSFDPTNPDHGWVNAGTVDIPGQSYN